MKTFEHYHDHALQESLRRDAEREIRSWARKQKQLNRAETNAYRLGFTVAVLVWAALVCVVLAVHGSKTPETEAPVETVYESETIEPIPATYLVVDDPLPIVDPAVVDREAQEPESPFYREDIPLDYETQELVYAACAESGISYELALAVIWRETTFRNVVGDSGESFGYMQVQPRWHGDRMARLGVTDLMEPAGNFRVACDYLAELLGKYELVEALTFYNTGSPGHNQYADDVIGYLEELR